jgi:hypothetical protein
MMVFSNHRIGPAAEVLVSDEVAAGMLRATAAAARPAAGPRWEHELVQWLEDRAASVTRLAGLDVADLAWTPEHFEAQRGFVIGAISEAALTSPHAGALGRWARLIEAHPRDSVQFGRRWVRHANV